MKPLIQHYRALTIVHDSTTKLHFLDCAYHPIFLNTTFRKPALLPSSANEEPNLVDPLYRAILSHGAPQKQSTEKEILSVTASFVPDVANRSF